MTQGTALVKVRVSRSDASTSDGREPHSVPQVHDEVAGVPHFEWCGTGE